jgi:hypothetical protein
MKRCRTHMQSVTTLWNGAEHTCNLLPLYEGVQNTHAICYHFMKRRRTHVQFVTTLWSGAEHTCNLLPLYEAAQNTRAICYHFMKRHRTHVQFVRLHEEPQHTCSTLPLYEAAQNTRWSLPEGCSTVCNISTPKVKVPCTLFYLTTTNHLSLSADTTPRMWAVEWVRYINKINMLTGNLNQ